MASSAVHGVLPRQSRDLYKPILRAYAFSYFGISFLKGTQIVSLWIKGKISAATALSKLVDLLRSSARIDSFPTLAACLIAASHAVPQLLAGQVAALLQRSGVKGWSTNQCQHVVRFISVFFAAVVAFKVLNRNDSDEPLKSTMVPATYAESVAATNGCAKAAVTTRKPQTPPSKPAATAGQTLFITSFAVVNACTALESILMSDVLPRPTRLASAVYRTGSTLFNSTTFFACSSSVIMWTWVYDPQSLPKAYNSWINSVAKLDTRLLDTMRKARSGELYYGKRTGVECHLPSLARELGHPDAWGDPTTTIPIPCDLFHCGNGPSCTWNAVHRFATTWLLTMQMCAPLHLAAALLKRPQPSSLRNGLISAARSSSFLGAFVSLICAGVCLIRTHAGPRLVGSSAAARMRLESGAAIAFGCAICGWSVLLEKKSRRRELAMFVAPRAIMAFLPREYDPSYMVREQLAFACSVATILTAAAAKPSSVRGLFGNMLRKVNA